MVYLLSSIGGRGEDQPFGLGSACAGEADSAGLSSPPATSAAGDGSLRGSAPAAGFGVGFELEASTCPGSSFVVDSPASSGFAVS